MRWIIGVCLAGLALAAMANDVGLIKSTAGEVYMEREGKRLPVQVGTAVHEADTLVTGMDGSAGITFSDNSLLSIGPNSVLAIDRYVFDSTTHAGQFDTSLKRGSLAVVSGKIVKQSPEAMRVRTPSSIMGVRGTEFVVRVTDTGN
jgi:hypothetical protein